MKMIFLCFVFLTFMGYSHAAKKTKCQVVAALRAQSVPDSDIRNWLCLVKYESSYRYDVTNTNPNRSKDYGIYQLNDKYWCGRTTTSYSKCWRINTHGCAVTCNSLLNSDITDDTACAVKVKNCNSFSKWLHSCKCWKKVGKTQSPTKRYGWVKNCKNVSGSEFDFSCC